MHRYRVFGYDDAPGSEVTESLREAYKTAEAAIAAARADMLATCVIDWETDEVLWQWDDAGQSAKPYTPDEDERA
jgi:hypothetical protein